jgi:hypothetical protein
MIEWTDRKLQMFKNRAHVGEKIDSATKHHENNSQECKHTRIIATNRYESKYIKDT